MSNPEFKHLSKVQLKKRVKIQNILMYPLVAMALGSFVFFFVTDYEYNWSWILNGVVFTLLTINIVNQTRQMLKEIEFREERLRKKQAAEG